MKMSRERIIFLILILTVVLVTAFILINSFMDYEKSHSSSGIITDLITSTDDLAEWDHTEFIVRKLAHLVEYSFLGLCVAALSVFLNATYNKKLYGYALFYVLLVSVTDEYIQSFTDRGSAISDVLLDFIGSLIGIVSVLLVALLLRRLRRNRALGKGKAEIDK